MKRRIQFSSVQSLDRFGRRVDMKGGGGYVDKSMKLHGYQL